MFCVIIAQLHLFEDNHETLWLFLFVSYKHSPFISKACGHSCLCPVNTCLPYLKYESCSCRKHLQYHYFITFAINFMPFLIMAFLPCSCYTLSTLFSLSSTKVSKNTRSSECGVCSTVGMFSAKNSSHIVMTYPVTMIMTSVALIVHCTLLFPYQDLFVKMLPHLFSSSPDRSY